MTAGAASRWARIAGLVLVAAILPLRGAHAQVGGRAVMSVSVSVSVHVVPLVRPDTIPALRMAAWRPEPVSGEPVLVRGAMVRYAQVREDGPLLILAYTGN